MVRALLKTASILFAMLSLATFAHAQAERYDALANSAMFENRPTPETSKLLKDELLFQRATQTYLWALPLINTLGMKFGSEKVFGAGYSILPVWKKRLDAKTLVTTPNSDVIYAMSYLDLGKDGPMVFEAAPGLQGILLDFWQRPIPGPTIDGHAFFGDVGLPGPDGGKGGKFVILPPGYTGPVPDGHFVYRSGTNNVFVFLRSFYQDPNDLKPAVDVMEATKIYPLGGQASAKPMQFPDASGVPANMLPVSDAGAFDQLKALVDGEGPQLADPDWRGMLAAIGIVQGQPFKPDAAARAILDRAAKTAYKMSRVIGTQETVAGRSFLIYPDRRWVNPVADGHSVESRRSVGSDLDQDCGQVPRPRRAHLVFYRLLCVEPWNDLADSGQGREVHGRLHRPRGHAAVGRRQLSREVPTECSGRELLVADALRSGKLVRLRQRPAIPFAWLAR